MITDIKAINESIVSFDAKKYSYTRNYVDGNISFLSPYISRGVISTKTIYNALKKRYNKFSEIEKYDFRIMVLNQTFCWIYKFCEKLCFMYWQSV